jgi:Ser/Thr protein kinase RdoA (MazF antagonist)
MVSFSAMSAERVAEKFAVDGRLVGITSAGAGNVNDTFLAVFRTSFSEQRVIVQRINTRVFKRPEWIMSNLRVLTDHVHGRLEREAARADRIWQLPRVIRAKDRKDYHRDARGGYWRAMTLIASASSYERVKDEAHAHEAGAVLGQFHRLVSDLDPARFRDTLPGFHETPLYLRSYDAVLATAPAAKRLGASALARELAAFIERRRAFAGVLEDARARRELKPRLIHGDPKVSNIMIDDLSGKGTSIVDLDTVKPGLTHYDFGDALRSLCNRAGEDAEEPERVAFDTGLCAAFVKGYMARARDFMTAADRKYLYDSVRLIAFELGLRFFADHLAGDKYFKVAAPGHNLRRAAVQLRLCRSIERREKDIRAVLARHAGSR